MRIKKYDFNYSKRHFLKQTAAGILGAGVLMPVWKALAANGDFAKAYPDELLSIEEFTKGKFKPGDVIDASNVEAVKDLLDPIRYMQISQQGRKLDLVAATTDMTMLSPVDYIEATLRNKGRAKFDSKGNVITDDGTPWIGGHPFPESKDAVEIFAGITLSWGRHDVSMYTVKEYDMDEQGNLAYKYEIVWVEFAATGRVTIDPKPHWPGHEDKLRYNTVVFVSPNDIKGTSFMNTWYYDQTLFPELIGYLPAFKRVRRFPTNQRFEPLIPGGTLYLSDVWTAGDPFLTWGNYKVIGRGPFLAGLQGNWHADNENWEGPTHGGPKGTTFWDTKVELIPETIIIEAEPVMYPRAPVSKKRVWFDARTLLPVGMVTYDRRGEVFKSFDGTYSLYSKGGKTVMDGAHPYWSWCNVHAHNAQTNRMTRLEQVGALGAGYKMSVNDASLFDDFLTEAAVRRLGT